MVITIDSRFVAHRYARFRDSYRSVRAEFSLPCIEECDEAAGLRLPSRARESSGAPATGRERGAGEQRSPSCSFVSPVCGNASAIAGSTASASASASQTVAGNEDVCGAERRADMHSSLSTGAAEAGAMGLASPVAADREQATRAKADLDSSRTSFSGGGGRGRRDMRTEQLCAARRWI